MNFIKKKFKGHKKDDEEEEYEKAVYEQSLHSQNPDQKMKSTEEWQFFQQLSMRVQDTVQKTQTTLNKLKDTHEEDGDNYSDTYDVDGELLSKDIPPYGKVLRAPPRPPPPAAEKAGLSSDLDFGSDLNHSSPVKGPPRPPPPTSDTPFSIDTSALHGTQSKSFASPARPPPPNIAKMENTFASDRYPIASDSNLTKTDSEKQNAPLSLLDEFGFSTDTEKSTAPANVQDLLFLDDKVVDDPFDTSFVDLNNPTSVQISTDRRNSKTDKSFNPFARSTTSNDWSTNNIGKSEGSSVTNPFFSSATSEVKPVSHDKSQPVSSNPFSFGDNTEDNKAQNDLFGINILPSSSKDNLMEDLLYSSKDPVTKEKESNNLSSLLDIETIQFDTKVEIDLDQNHSFSNKIAFEQDDIWNSEKNDLKDILPANIIKNGDISRTAINSADSALLWDSNPIQTDILIPQKPALENDLSESRKYEDDPGNAGVVRKDSKTNSDFIFSSDSTSLDFENKIGNILQPTVDILQPNVENKNISQPRKISEPAVDDILQTKGEDILQPSIEDIMTTKAEDVQQEKAEDVLQPKFENILESKAENDFEEKQSKIEDILQPKVKNMSEPQVEGVFQPKSTDILQPQTGVLHTEVDNVQTSVDETYTNAIENEFEMSKYDTTKSAETTKLNAFNDVSAFNEEKREISNDINSKPFESEVMGSSDQINAQLDTNDFSKPFDEENENAFVFKVKAIGRETDSEFDAFAAKFENVKDNNGDAFDPFANKKAPTLKKIQENYKGFESMDEFDPFKITIKPDDFQNVMKKEPSRDSFEDYDNEVDFSVVIKPKVKDSTDVKLPSMEPPKLLPPPKTPTKAFDTPASRFNPFDKDFSEGTVNKAAEKTYPTLEIEEEPVPALGEAGVRKADSVETPLSPLFDEDTSLPLEVFPKPYDKEGWEMVLRQPNKKKLTGNRFWKKIFVKLSENSVLQLFNKSDDKLPFQELPLQACYSLSEIGAQQYDQYGKIFTVKLQYKFYRERVGVRPGQISKVTQGQVTSMGDVAKLGLPLQHSPQTSQLLKLGSQSYSDMKFFIQEVEDALFRMVVHRDRVLTYKTEEVQVIAQDEFYVEQSKTGHVDKQLARVRIFFLAFITGMPSVEVGLNDIIRQGREVVGRYDIIPVVTEEWIRLEDCEFHSCVEQDEFYKSRVIKFHPPDACLFELLRFRIRPPKNRELPLQVRVFMTVSNTSVEIRSDILVPGYSSRKQGQVPCENIQIRFPVPECWIYLFRTEKHFRYGSKKSTARRPGKIKGLERIIGAAQNLDPSLIEVSAGSAKYEHVFHAVVWRIPRLPKEGQGAYTQQLFLLRTELTSFDQIPETFEKYVDIEFTMPATYVSHTTVRSVSVTNPTPPEKYVKYISKHEYKVEIDFKNSTDEIDGLIPSPGVNVPVSTTPVVHESTEDEEKDDNSD